MGARECKCALCVNVCSKPPLKMGSMCLKSDITTLRHIWMTAPKPQPSNHVYRKSYFINGPILRSFHVVYLHCYCFNSYFFLILGMFTSVIFIIATLIVYGCIPKLHNLNGICLMNYLTVLAIGYAFMAWSQFSSVHSFEATCLFSGYIMFFTFVSAFSWLNVINFDFWLNSKLMIMKTVHNSTDRMDSLMIW